MTMRDVVYLGLSLEELDMLRECVRVALEEGDVLLKRQCDPVVTFDRAKVIYVLRGRMDRLVPAPLEPNRRLS